MLYQFDTGNMNHAKAALLLYAMYRSRDSKSSLNGLETWDRFAAYVRGACLKSATTAEFVQNFCRKANIASIRPRYLDTGDPVLMPDTGEMVVAEGVRDYQTRLFEDDSLLRLFETETLYLIMLVRERIQREKIQHVEVDLYEDED